MLASEALAGRSPMPVLIQQKFAWADVACITCITIPSLKIVLLHPGKSPHEYLSLHLRTTGFTKT